MKRANQRHSRQGAIDYGGAAWVPWHETGPEPQLDLLVQVISRAIHDYQALKGLPNPERRGGRTNIAAGFPVPCRPEDSDWEYFVDQERELREFFWCDEFEGMCDLLDTDPRRIRRALGVGPLL